MVGTPRIELRFPMYQIGVIKPLYYAPDISNLPISFLFTIVSSDSRITVQANFSLSVKLSKFSLEQSKTLDHFLIKRSASALLNCLIKSGAVGSRTRVLIANLNTSTRLAMMSF